MAITVTTNDASDITTTVAVSGGTVSGNTGEYVPIVDIIMKNKFKLYNKTREKLSGTIINREMLRPFQLIEDSLQVESTIKKKFVLGASSFKPISGELSLTLVEYDNTTDINLTDI